VNSIAIYPWRVFCLFLIQAFLSLQVTAATHIHADDDGHDEPFVCTYCLVVSDETPDHDMEMEPEGSDTLPAKQRECHPDQTWKPYASREGRTFTYAARAPKAARAPPSRQQI